MSILIPTQLIVGILIVQDGKVTVYSEVLNNALDKMLTYSLSTVLWKIDEKNWRYPILDGASLDSFTGQIPVASYTVNNRPASFFLNDIEFGWIGLVDGLVSSKSENLDGAILLGDSYDKAFRNTRKKKWKCGDILFTETGTDYAPVVRARVEDLYVY